MEEVARLLLPVPVSKMDRLVSYLEGAYGKDITFRTEGGWMIFERPKS
jgi:hypothetical protein